MTREEAIRRIKAWNLDSNDMEVLAVIIPELKESEDERIRKFLVKHVSEWIGCIEHDLKLSPKDVESEEELAMFKAGLAYLEKQKEQPTNEEMLRTLRTEYEKGVADTIAKYEGMVVVSQEEWDTAIADAFKYGMDEGEKQKEQMPIKVYRVENEKEQKGLWRKFDGTWEPLFDILTDGLCRDLPMEDNDLYRADGKQWFASAPSRQTLQKWFSKRDLEELTSAGFTISEFEVRNYKKVSEFEYIFTRDSITKRTYLNVSDIYPEQKRDERDFTIYHPLKNGKGEYECIPYSFFGSLTSFSEDKDLIDFLRTCFYTEEECNEWIEQQKEQNQSCNNLDGEIHRFFDECIEVHDAKIYGVDERVITVDCYELTARHFAQWQKEQKPAEWSEEDERLLNVIIDILDREEHNGHITHNELKMCVRLLKSLRPYPKVDSVEYERGFLAGQGSVSHWKPSEERMRVFFKANPVNLMPEELATYHSLYNDFQKL